MGKIAQKAAFAMQAEEQERRIVKVKKKYKKEKGSNKIF